MYNRLIAESVKNILDETFGIECSHVVVGDDDKGFHRVIVMIQPRKYDIDSNLLRQAYDKVYKEVCKENKDFYVFFIDYTFLI